MIQPIKKASKASPKDLRLNKTRKEYAQYMFEADIKAKKGSQLQMFKEMNCKTKTPTVDFKKKILDSNKKSPKLKSPTTLTLIQKKQYKSISNLPSFKF